MPMEGNRDILCFNQRIDYQQMDTLNEMVLDKIKGVEENYKGKQVDKEAEFSGILLNIFFLGYCIFYFLFFVILLSILPCSLSIVIIFYANLAVPGNFRPEFLLPDGKPEVIKKLEKEMVTLKVRATERGRHIQMY